MANRLTRACASAVTRHVDDLLSNRPMVADVIAELALDGVFDFSWMDLDAVRQLLINIEIAKERFRQIKLDWWAEELPVTAEACEALQFYPDVRKKILGCFGASLRFVHWNPKHIDFSTYGRALMAHPFFPIDWQKDPALRREFPPQCLMAADPLAIVPMNQIAEDLRFPFWGQRPSPGGFAPYANSVPLDQAEWARG